MAGHDLAHLQNGRLERKRALVRVAIDLDADKYRESQTDAIAAWILARA